MTHAERFTTARARPSLLNGPGLMDSYVFGAGASVMRGASLAAVNRIEAKDWSYRRRS